MTNALKNAIKLRAWADPISFGADPTGVALADAAFALAMATGKPIRVPKGTFLLSAALTKALTIGQDFNLSGEGPEVSRLVFTSAATHGISITYSTNSSGQAQGDKTGVCISGLDIETQKAGGGSAIRIINSPPAGQVNETQVALEISNIRTNGADNASYWDIHTELQNVTFPNLRDLVAQDSADRGIGISLNSTGDYSAVEFTIENYRANEIGTALKVRGRCEGVYASHFVAVGGVSGVDWVATVVAGGKKPLLLLSASHINVSNTAVATTDVAQVIGADSLIYVTNSAVLEAVAFDFAATGALSNENNQVKGVTVIGIGSRVGSLGKAVKLGANVSGCAVDILVDNVGTAIANAGNNNFISPGTKISNCNVRTTGFTAVGAYGEAGTTASIDGSWQMEYSDGTRYERDMGREQLRVESFVFTSTAIDETITRALTRPFRTDTLNLVVCWGEVPTVGAVITASLAASTSTNLQFKTVGTSIGSIYRVNYIAYGY